MANALGTLFSEIAEAIRGKTGDTATMKPAEFPVAIDEIEMGADTDEIDKFLDTINGEVVGENLYTVTFIGSDGAELCQLNVYEGYDCADPVATGVIETPTKESTRYIDYAYNGWTLTEGGSANSDVLTAVEGNLTVYAAFRKDYIYLEKGSCGDNASYTIDPDYVLTIRGTGAIASYRYSPPTESWETGTIAPWRNNYQNLISKVIIENGITTITSYAFYDLTALTEASFADTVKDLEGLCFHGCSSLQTVDLSNNLGTIGYHTFYGCSALTTINIPASVWWMTQGAFNGCTNLESIVFGRTTGWVTGSDIQDSGTHTSIPAEELEDPATAVLSLSKYTTNNWYNLEAYAEKDGVS